MTIKIDRQCITIPKGGMVLLHSDGLNEAADAQGKEFGFERIQEELLACRRESARTICDRLWVGRARVQRQHGRAGRLHGPGD